MTSYTTFDLQIRNRATSRAVLSSGGKFIVTAGGDVIKSTLFNPDSNYAALTNAITPTRGRLRFALAQTPAELSVSGVDVWGFCPNGRFIHAYKVLPGGISDLWVDYNGGDCLAELPFYGGDYTATTETDIGLDFPVGTLIHPGMSMYVATLQASKTLDVGLLSSETNGDADGLLDGVSLNAAGLVPATVAGTPTLGALLLEVSEATSTKIRKTHAVTGSNATSISFTSSSGTTTAKAIVRIPYTPPQVA